MTLGEAQALLDTLIARTRPGAQRLGGDVGGRLLAVERRGSTTLIYTPTNLLTVRGRTVRVQRRAISPTKEPTP